jgi:hypothetical protein
MPASTTSVTPAPGAPAGAAANPASAPAWASASAAAPEKKPSGMRRFFSFLWHGGSSRPDEADAKPIYRASATGRNDLPNARPWEMPAPR